MSIPPREMDGMSSFERGASYRESRSEAMVDLPEPERPTIAVQAPWGMVIDKSLRMSASGRDGYLKFTLVNLTGAVSNSVISPRCSWEVPCGRLARRSSWLALSRDVLIWGTGHQQQITMDR